MKLIDLTGQTFGKLTVINGSYCAQIGKDGLTYYLGLYKTIKEAADAYDLKAKELFGKFAYLNNYLESELMTNEQN